MHPFGKAATEAAAGFALGVVAGATGANRAVVQRLTRTDVVWNSEDQKAVVHEDNLQRETGEFAAAGQAAGRGKRASEFAFNFWPERAGHFIPPAFHFPGDGAHVCRRTDGNAIAPNKVVGGGFVHVFQAHFCGRDARSAFDHQIGHHFCVALAAEIEDQDAGRTRGAGLHGGNDKTQWIESKWIFLRFMDSQALFSQGVCSALNRTARSRQERQTTLAEAKASARAFFSLYQKLKSTLTNMTQTEKALRFQALHQRAGAFLIPNPWDAGSARILSALGFEAFATSSGAAAATFGKRDGRISREEAIASARAIANATDLPVSGDMESGFGDSPERAAETVRMAAEAGLVGCSIEDFSGDPNQPLFEIQLAAERICAAVEAAKSLSFPFTLTARAENFVRGRPDLDDTIKRLQAYEKAGADVLFAPSLPDLAAVRAICSAVSKPVNFMVGVRGKSFSVAELAEAGVKRISFASSLYRAAITGLIVAASEVKRDGTFGYLEKTITTAELNKFLPE